MTTIFLKRICGAAALAGLLSLVAPAQSQAATVTLFQTGGDSAADFAGLNLQTLGNVQFGVPLAKLFGRDTDATNTPLPNAVRYANDFLGTLADGQFLASDSYTRTEARGILFSLGEFDNPLYPANSQAVAGLTFTVSVPEQVGALDRRINIQFGKGRGPFGPIPIGNGPGRKFVLKARPGDIPEGAKKWAQFINDLSSFDIRDFDEDKDGMLDEDELAALRAIMLDKAIAEAIKRGSLTGKDDPRKVKYEKLADGTRFEDPVESFYVDFENDTGEAFSFDIQIVFENDLFTALAQFLDNLTVEIGETSDFLGIYDDVPNNAFLGTVPITIDLASVAAGANPGVSLGGVDALVPIPLPAGWLLLISGLAAIGVARRNA